MLCLLRRPLPLLAASVVALGLSAAGEGLESPATPPGPQPSQPKAAAEWDARRVAALIARLSEEQFATREAATQELGSAPARFLRTVQAAAGQAEDPEVKARLERAAKQVFTGQVLPHLPEARKGQGFLGIRWYVCPDPPGILVQEVIADTAAAQGGVQPGDVLVQVDEQSFEPGLSHEEAMDVWRAMLPGDHMVLKARRAEAADLVELKLVVGEAPAEYKRPDSNADKAEQLWLRYLRGKLQVPNTLLGDSPSTSAAGAAKNAAATPGRPPLQSWPRELEAKE
jgi:hypothetical protein